MVFKILCILIFWVKVDFALEGLRASLVVEAMLHHIIYFLRVVQSQLQEFINAVAESQI